MSKPMLCMNCGSDYLVERTCPTPGFGDRLAVWLWLCVECAMDMYEGDRVSFDRRKRGESEQV